MDLSVISSLWSYAVNMIKDVITIVSGEPLLVCLVVALPLIGLGVGLFKRIIN